MHSSMQKKKDKTMEHKTHTHHNHIHQAGCGHTSIQHGNHIDYIHDGHLHKIHEDHVDECNIEVSSENPNSCTPTHNCSSHDSNHVHGDNCGHEKVPHGDHFDFLVNGHLHHPHGNHCDDHGKITVLT